MTWIFRHLTLLLSQFCQNPTCQCKIQQTAEMSRSKSTQPGSQSLWSTPNVIPNFMRHAGRLRHLGQRQVSLQLGLPYVVSTQKRESENNSNLQRWQKIYSFCFADRNRKSKIFVDVIYGSSPAGKAMGSLLLFEGGEEETDGDVWGCFGQTTNCPRKIDYI